jgi:hypothetical protein
MDFLFQFQADFSFVLAWHSLGYTKGAAGTAGKIPPAQTEQKNIHAVAKCQTNRP